MIHTVNISQVTKGAVVCGLTLMTGCADMERGFSDRDMDQFVTAMISQGCVVKDKRDAADVELATGFSEEKLTNITDYLTDKKLIIPYVKTAGIILINEGCP